MRMRENNSESHWNNGVQFASANLEYRRGQKVLNRYWLPIDFLSF